LIFAGLILFNLKAFWSLWWDVA